jgi:hypothetical protein
MTVPSYFNVGDIVLDRNTGIKYIVTENMKLKKVTDAPYDVLPDDELDYHYDMELRYYAKSHQEKKMVSYGLYTGDVKEKPVDIEEKDWEEYKQKNSINLHLTHNPIFDGVVGPQQSPLESHKFIVIDNGKPIAFEINRTDHGQQKT